VSEQCAPLSPATSAENRRLNSPLTKLDPLPLTDPVVFARPLPEEAREKVKDIPKALLWEYKLLINNEAYDARPAP
jgi:hypothetical protein